MKQTVNKQITNELVNSQQKQTLSTYRLTGGNITSAGWQVTLCDPMWHVSSRSGVATLRTAIHLLLTKDAEKMQTK